MPAQAHGSLASDCRLRGARQRARRSGSRCLDRRACTPAQWLARADASDARRSVLQRAAAVAAAAALCLQPLGSAAAALAALPPAAEASAAAQAAFDAPRALPPLPTSFPPLGALPRPSYQQLRLSNGLRVILLEDHEVPVVRGTLLMRGGQRSSPPDKVGLATISGQVQRAGGSAAHPAAALDAALEDRGAYIEGGASAEAFSLGFQCLSEDLAEVVGLFAEVVLQPAVPQDKLDQAKAQVINLLAHRNDNPAGIPARELAKLVYGRDSVFARSPTPEQVAALTTDDVRALLVQWERPDSAVLGVLGDFDSRGMRGLLESKLGGWAAPPEPLPQLPNPPLPDQAPHAGVAYVVDRPGATQTSLALGEPGIALDDPDQYSLDVLSDILNSFGGRLFDDVRSREGLAYSVSAGWLDSPIDHPGLFLASAETAQPAALLGALLSVLRGAVEQAPSAEEVARAKSSALNSFVFNFASPAAQLSRTVAYTLLGIPQDYLLRYRSGVEGVTPAGVLAAAQRHLHPDRLTAVLVGDAASLRPALRGLGWEVRDLELD